MSGIGSCTAEWSRKDFELVCNLTAGHDGPHWDGFDDLTWKAGRPGQDGEDT